MFLEKSNFTAERRYKLNIIDWNSTVLSITAALVVVISSTLPSKEFFFKSLLEFVFVGILAEENVL